MPDISIKITDPRLKFSFLADMVHAIDRDGIDELLHKGVHPTFIDGLRKRPTRDLMDAAFNAHFDVVINVNAADLETCLNRVDLVRKDAHLKEYFIRRGAPAGLMRAMFKLSKLEADALRKQFNVDSHAGRTCLPPKSDRDCIHMAWHRILKDHPNMAKREQFHRLMQEFEELTAPTLWGVIKEFYKMSAEPQPLLRKLS